MSKQKNLDPLSVAQRAIGRELKQISSRFERLKKQPRLTKRQWEIIEADSRRLEEIEQEMDLGRQEFDRVRDRSREELDEFDGMIHVYQAMSAKFSATEMRAKEYETQGDILGAMKIRRELVKEAMAVNLRGWELWAKTQLTKRGWEVTQGNDGWRFSFGGTPIATNLPPEASLLIGIRETRQAIVSRDPLEIASVSFDLMLKILATGQAHILYPRSLDIARDAIQSARARKPRRPRLRTRAMLAAFADGRENADAVEGFFRDGGEFEDQWGEISIFPDDDNRDAFGVIDLGARLSTDRKRPTATITKKSIPALIAQTRKKPV